MLITHPCPVAEGEHQRNQSGFQFGQGCQVIGGKTSHVVACTDFAQQATAQKKRKERKLGIYTNSKGFRRVFGGRPQSEC